MRSKFRNLLAWLFVADLLLTQLALYISEVARQAVPLGRYIPPGLELYDPVLLHLVVLVIWPLILVSLGVYEVERTGQPIGSARTLVVALIVATFASAGVLYFSWREVPRLLVGYFLVADLFLLALIRLIFGLVIRYRRSKGKDVVRVLVVGANELGAAVAGALDANIQQGYLWAGFADDDLQGDNGLPVLGRLADVPDLVRRRSIDEVIVALPSTEFARIEALVHNLQTVPVRIRIVPDFFRLAMVRACIDNLCGIPLIGIREPLIEGANWATKRAFDLIVGSTLLIALSPFMLLMAILIRLDSTGPVLFRQERIGENGRSFSMFKFRTMYCGTEARLPCEEVALADGQTAPVYKMRRDPRVTRVGRVLRRLSLDELPQLFNVIRGEMSLVGPRPEQAFIVEQYKEWQRQRLAVPPGITGWWQVSGRSDLPMHLNTEYDLFYIRNYSIWLDVKILFRTVGAVISGRGAY